MTAIRHPASKTVAPGNAAAPVIAILAFEGISPFHLAVPSMVFGENRSDLGVPPFTTLICAEQTGRLRTSVGFDIDVKQGLEAIKQADIVIVPSWRENEEASSPRLMHALRQANQRGARVVGLCLGAAICRTFSQGQARFQCAVR
jgi:transcriptional regulator GlxA family with amidase domain